MSIRVASCALSALALFTLSAHHAEATTVIGGISFDDNAFANVVLAATPTGSGHFHRETPPDVNQALTLPADFSILQAAVVGANLDEWVSLRTSDARLTIGFTDLIAVDGPGADIAIFETGVTAHVGVTIEGVHIDYTSQNAGTINLVLIDLADFGLTTASAITISSNSILNDIAGIAAIHYVPEPSAVLMLLIGGLPLLARRIERFIDIKI